MGKHGKKFKETLDYHEGLSPNQVKIILREMGFAHRTDEFSDWLNGQTGPLLDRRDADGKLVQLGGVYEYDLFRWIWAQKNGTATIWD